MQVVGREASAILESGADSDADFPFPDALYHPLLAKSLLVHTAEWGRAEALLRAARRTDGGDSRRDITALLGYGCVRPERVARAATNRAVLVAAGAIGRDQMHTYDVPLPPSLRSKADWHRFTVTLSYLVPTIGQLTRYRGAKVFFEWLDGQTTGGSRIDADHHAVRRGSIQHEIVEGTRAAVFGEGASLPIHVQCMDDARRLRTGQTLRYALALSVETAVTTSTTIHDEIRTALRVRARTLARTRVQP